MKTPYHKSVLIALGAISIIAFSSCRNTAHGVVNDTQRNTKKVERGVERVGNKIGEGVERTGEKIQESTR